MVGPSEQSERARTLHALAVRAAGGDQQAFTQIHGRLNVGVRRFLETRLGRDAERVEEIAQRTWFETWRAMREKRYDPARSAVTTFVYAIAYKQYLRDRRGHGYESAMPEMDAIVAEEIGSDMSLDNTLHLVELLEALRHCIDQDGLLTDDERAVINGLADEETERQLAARLGLAASTVHVRKKSAHAKLRACLANKGFHRDSSERGQGHAE